MSSRWWLAFVPGLLVVAAAVAVRVADGGYGPHFGGGQLGINSASYTARIADNLARHGFQQMRFGSPFVVIPTEPLTVEQHNLRHPPPFFLIHGFLFQVFGRRPEVMQVATAVVHLLTVLAITALLLAMGRPWVAAGAGALAAGLPLGAHYGFMAASNGCIVLWITIATLGYWRWRETGTRRWLLLMVFATSWACQMDWWGYFILPALMLDLVLFERPSAWRAAVGVALIGVVNGLATYLHMAYVLDDLGAAFHHVLSLGSQAKDSSVAVGPLDLAWYVPIGGFLVKFVMWPGLALVVAGVAVGVATGLGRVMLILAVFGTLNQLVLTYYASTHDYWIFVYLPLFAVAGGAALAPFLRSPSWILRALGTAILVAVCWLGITRASEVYRSELWTHVPMSPEKVAAFINRHSGKGDMVFTTVETTMLSMHVEAPFCFGPVATPEILDIVLERFCKSPPARGHIWFLISEPEMATDLGRTLASRWQSESFGPIRRFRITLP